MPSVSRSYWLPATLLLYVGAVAARARGHLPLALLPLGLALALSVLWRSTEAPRRGVDPVEPAARQAMRHACWGAALWVTARLAPPGLVGFDAAAAFGQGVSVVAALIALARVPSAGGVLVPPPITRSLDAAGFAALLSAIAFAIPATRAVLPDGRALLDPITLDWLATASAATCLLLLVMALARVWLLRRLELGVADRVSGALALSLSAVGVAVPAAALGVAPPDRALPVALLIAAVASSWAATTRAPAQVTAAQRAVLAILLTGAPVVVLGGVLGRRYPELAPAIVVASSSLAIGVGLLARAVARPLGPEQSRWLQAIDVATRGALQPEPDSAIRAALLALTQTTGEPGASPELWRLHPAEALSVDLAGYLHARAVEAPPLLLELAVKEPERSLRTDALLACQVRRPEVRPLLAWLQEHQAFCATAVLDDDGPTGFLLLPVGSRTRPLSLEEAVALRRLADRLSALLSISSSLARSRERELDAQREREQLEAEQERLRTIITAGAGRHRIDAERRAEPLRGSAYSPAARWCLDHLERLARRGGPIALVTPPGVPAESWCAHWHLASARADGPLFIVDATRAHERSPELWEDPQRSPLQLAAGGSLLVLDAGALPHEVRALLGRLLKAPRPPLEPPFAPPTLALAFRSSVRDAGAGQPPLLTALEGSTVTLPSLQDRAEDLRALILAELGRAGSALRGEPLGVEPLALAALLEHAWPGNDRELTDVLQRAALRAQGQLLTLAELELSGFTLPPPPAPLTTPLPLPGGRLRGRARTARGPS